MARRAGVAKAKLRVCAITGNPSFRLVSRVAHIMLRERRLERDMVHGRAVFGVAAAAIGASLLGMSGLAGPIGTQLLLVFAAVVALSLTRALPRD